MADEFMTGYADIASCAVNAPARRRNGALRLCSEQLEAIWTCRAIMTFMHTIDVQLRTHAVRI